MSSSAAAERRTNGPRVARFIETFCRQSRGQLAGAPVLLRDWQREILDELFTLRDDGLRQHRTGLLGLPRKNGKSTLGSALALYLLVADGEAGAEVYSCAGDRQQARIVFNEARKMVEASPDLSSILTVYRDVIHFPRTQGVYRVLSADARLQQGLNPSACLFDEVHVQPDDELWNALVLGMGTRAQPLMLGITTAGYDEESLLWKLYEYGRKVQSGEIDDPTFWFRWWEPARADCDWRDPAVWAECNPALGDFLHEEALAADARTTAEHEYRRYHLNQWTRAANAWLPFGAWDGCLAPDLQLDPALPICAGIDVALRNDSTAVVIAQRREVGPEHAPKPLELARTLAPAHARRGTDMPDGLVSFIAEEDDDAPQPEPVEQTHERTIVRARVWENPYPEGDNRRELWALDVREVEEYLKALFSLFPSPAVEIDGEVRPGPAYVYDPSYFSRSAQVLQGEQLAMVEFPQSDARMIPASQGLYQLIVEGKLAHDGDPALARHVGNAAADQKPRGWRLTKPRGSRKKIDAAIAMAFAVHQAQQEPPTRRVSVYETRGVRTL